MLCDYGCGQKAIHQFKNGRWCCNTASQRCPVFKNKLSKANIGKHLNESTKKLISIANKNKVVSKITKKRISIKNTGQKSWSKGKKFNQSYKKNFQFSIEQWIEKFPTFAKIEEMRYNPDKPDEKEIQVHCKNHLCSNSKEQGGWFTPTREQIYNRKRCIENNYDGSYFYCCEECKKECPLFNKQIYTLLKEDLIAAGHIDDPWYTSTEYLTWREHIFGLDIELCVYCGEPATVAHHILPQKTHPELALDPENGISVCKECHFKYGHRDPWCTTGYLSTLVCQRIVRMKEFR